MLDGITRRSRYGVVGVCCCGFTGVQPTVTFLASLLPTSARRRSCVDRLRSWPAGLHVQQAVPRNELEARAGERRLILACGVVVAFHTLRCCRSREARRALFACRACAASTHAVDIK